MSNIGFLHFLLKNLCSTNEIYFSHTDISCWPQPILDELLDTQLLKPASPKTDITCYGCEKQCPAMEVTIYPETINKPAKAFIRCDQPEDRGSIDIDLKQMERWFVSIDLFAKYLAFLINLPIAEVIQKTSNEWDVGLYKGNKNQRPLKLIKDSEFNLSIAGHVIPLTDLIDSQNDKIIFNKNKLNYYVDNPTGTSDTPEQKRIWAKTRRDELKAKKFKGGILKQLAEEKGCSVSMIRKWLYPAPSSKNKKKY